MKRPDLPGAFSTVFVVPKLQSSGPTIEITAIHGIQSNIVDYLRSLVALLK